MQINTRVRIKESGQEGKIIKKTGEVLHIKTDKGDIVRTVVAAVEVLHLLDKILSKLIQVFTLIIKRRKDV